MNKNSILFINNIKLENTTDYKELSALVDGEKIYLKVPHQFNLILSAEFFIGCALLEAMATNRQIVVEDHIKLSSRFFKNIHEVQAIYSCWNSSLSIVEIISNQTSVNLSLESVGVFFSAGVDSSHSLLKNMDEITHLIMLDCFDNNRDQGSWLCKLERQNEFAETLNKSLVPIQTNVRVWAEKKRISWEFLHGLVLSSLGGALGMKKVYVPSSHTYDELFPWGSHPLSDPMWSTDSTEVFHDGARFKRAQKMRDILECPIVADNLQVCWKYIHKNCGECPKCIRTMTSAYLLGHEISSLPKFNNSKKQIKLLKAKDESGATYLEDAMLLAEQTKNDELFKILKCYYRNYRIKVILPLIDRYILGSILKTLYRHVHKQKWMNLRVALRRLD